MLKNRIIGLVIVKNGIVVQSKKFRQYLPVGDPKITLEYFDKWGIDEIILLDISATSSGETKTLNVLDEITSNCFVPVTYGGGLNSKERIYKAFNNGADKVSFNYILGKKNDLIQNTIKEFGRQSVVASIDFIETDNGNKVYDYSKNKNSNKNLYEFVEYIDNLGVGEILINCVNRDGTYNGFSLDSIKELKNIKAQLILSGGARKVKHFKKGFKIKNLSALAASNMFHFYEHSVSKLKANLKDCNIRQNNNILYDSHIFDSDLRIKKLNDNKLESLIYKKLIDEDI